MKTRRRTLCCLAICIILLSLAGCGKKTDDQFASINSICELASLKCYYHNVAEFSDPGNSFIVRYGNKTAWIEYSGIVKMGVDASKISVDPPDKNGNVVVTMPHAKVLSVNLDIDSINEDWVENGLFAKIDAEDRTKAIAEAQANMKENATSNPLLIKQSEERAKAMINQYIVFVGEKLGKNYTVTWNMIE